MNASYSKKFLWLPKRINGHWVWLRSVTVVTEDDFMFIDGQYTVYRKKYYQLGGNKDEK